MEGRKACAEKEGGSATVQFQRCALTRSLHGLMENGLCVAASRQRASCIAQPRQNRWMLQGCIALVDDFFVRPWSAVAFSLRARGLLLLHVCTAVSGATLALFVCRLLLCALVV